jgi:hypothetical protein
VWTRGEYGDSGGDGNGVVRDALCTLRQSAERSSLAPNIGDRVEDFALLHRTRSADEKVTCAADEESAATVVRPRVTMEPTVDDVLAHEDQRG